MSRLTYPLGETGVGAVPLFDPVLGYINGLDDLVARMVAPTAVTQYVTKFGSKTKDTLQETSDPGSLYSMWQYMGSPEVSPLPPTGQAPSSATPGAIRYDNAGGGRTKYVVGFQAMQSLQDGTYTVGPRQAILYDRLFSQSDLDAQTLTAQTVSGPPITRNVGGVGNKIYVEVDEELGTSGTAYINVNYTNQDGTAGRQTGNRAFGITPAYSFENGAMMEQPLQIGDTGVQSIQSVDLTASFFQGKISVVIGLPIAYARTAQRNAQIDQSLGFVAASVEDDACLAIFASDDAEDQTAWTFAISFVEA